MINYRLKRSIFLILVVLTSCMTTAQAGNVQFSDQTFNDADWTVIIESCGSVCDFITQQELVDGNPGFFRSVYQEITDTPGNIHLAHIFTNSAYDPSTGPIISIDFNFDAVLLDESGRFAAVTYEFLLMQNGLIYQAPSSTGRQVGPDSPTPSGIGDWVSISGTGLAESDFIGSGSLDFSVSGLPIYFGYRSANSAGSGPPPKFTLSGIDNWEVSLTIAVPSLSCVGFEPPMNIPVTVRKNRALPLKAELFDADGNAITVVDLVALPVIQVIFTSNNGGSPIDVTNDALPAGQGTEGNEFVFNGEGKLQYNLSTKNYTAPGTYYIIMESGDPNEYEIDPTCEAIFVVE